MKRFIRFPKIGQFRNVIQDIRLRLMYVGKDENDNPIYDTDKVLPKISFKGTVKVHGTNAGIGFHEDEIWFQKRTGIVTPEKDNAGFATFFSGSNKIEALKILRDQIRETLSIPKDHILVVFGEFAGERIQRGVAVSQLPKSFYLFGIKSVEGAGEDVKVTWHPIKGFSNPEIRIFNIEDYETFEVELDLDYPKILQNKLVEITNAVEKECPVAKTHGVSGIGEGVVYTAFVEGNRHTFKVKGEKHSVTKNKTLAPVDVEKIRNIEEFVEYAVTQNRLEQGIEQVFTSEGATPTIRQTGDFIRWVSRDIASEEIDTLSKNNLTMRDVGSTLSRKAKDWFFKHLDEIALGK